MAFGQRSSQSSLKFGPNTKVFFVGIKEKNLPQPFFVIQRKEGEKYITVAGVDQQIKYLNGDLVDVRNKKYKHEGKEIESVTATFVDRVKDEAYLLTISHGYLGRNIMNSLLSLTSFNDIEIGLYVTKPKKPGQTKGFNSAAVRQNQRLIYGKFKNEELPKIPKIQVGKEVHSDTTEITAFFVAQMEEFAKVVKAAAPAGPATASNSVSGNTGADEAATAAAFDAEPSPEATPEEDIPTLPGGKKLLF